MKDDHAMIKRALGRILGVGGGDRSLEGQYAKRSYSQSGEDLIVDYVFHWLGLKSVTYLDIGANHPHSLSNTFYFYQRGFSGVLVEPDPDLCLELARARQRDVCLNVGVGGQSQRSAKYYVMSDKAMSTFSEAEARRYESYGKLRIEAVRDVELVGSGDLIERHFAVPPNFVSIDVEGLDYEIARAFDFQRFRPEVFCIETLTYTEDRSERKLSEIVELMQSHGYFVYADSYLNTIFVDNRAWARRR